MAQAHQHFLSYVALSRAGREAEGLNALTLAAQAAHPGALYSLALIDLGAPDRSKRLTSAADKLEAAARQGHSGACQTLAVMIALGAGREQSWQAAVDLLLQSARRGDPGAIRELAFILEMTHSRHALVSQLFLQAARSQDVLALYAAIRRFHAGICAAQPEEVAFWTQALAQVKHPRATRLPRLTATTVLPRQGAPAPLNANVAGELRELLMSPPPTARQGRRISSEPTIIEFKQFMSEEECDYLVGLSGPMLKPTTVYDPSTGTVRMNPVRTSSEASFWLSSQSLAVHCLNARICAASGVPIECGEALSVLVYQPGQQYLPHFDFFGDNTSMIPDFADSGQRSHTMLTYLVDDYIGGQTHFLTPDLKYRGRSGDAIVFHNTLEDGAPDRTTKHAGLPVEQGVKWLASKWMRERRVLDHI